PCSKAACPFRAGKRHSHRGEVIVSIHTINIRISALISKQQIGIRPQYLNDVGGSQPGKISRRISAYAIMSEGSKRRLSLKRRASPFSSDVCVRHYQWRQNKNRPRKNHPQRSSHRRLLYARKKSKSTAPSQNSGIPFWMRCPLAPTKSPQSS